MYARSLQLQSTSLLVFYIDFAQIVSNWILPFKIPQQFSKTPFLMAAYFFLKLYNFIISYDRFRFPEREFVHLN